MSESKRVEIGFDGGQVLAARLDADALNELQNALRGEGGWYQLGIEEGELAIDVGKVVFLRSATNAKGIGFSG